MKANQSYVTKAGRERQGNTASKKETGKILRKKRRKLKEKEELCRPGAKPKH